MFCWRWRLAMESRRILRRNLNSGAAHEFDFRIKRQSGPRLSNVGNFAL
jgi:hypothetical protein